MLAYGQTGSGKTFTISGILDRIGFDLFKQRNPDTIRIRVSLFELLGTQVCFNAQTTSTFYPEWDNFEAPLLTVCQCCKQRINLQSKIKNGLDEKCLGLNENFFKNDSHFG